MYRSPDLFVLRAILCVIGVVLLALAIQSFIPSHGSFQGDVQQWPLRHLALAFREFELVYQRPLWEDEEARILGWQNRLVPLFDESPQQFGSATQDSKFQFLALWSGSYAPLVVNDQGEKVVCLVIQITNTHETSAVHDDRMSINEQFWRLANNSRVKMMGLRLPSEPSRRDYCVFDSTIGDIQEADRFDLSGIKPKKAEN